MKTINIQYLYFDDKVCGRCKDTEAELKEAITELSNTNQNVRINLEKKQNYFFIQKISFTKRRKNYSKKHIILNVRESFATILIFLINKNPKTIIVVIGRSNSDVVCN